MLKLLTAGIVAAFLVSDASAQTSSQWSQLVGYVGQQSKLIIDLRLRMEQMEAQNKLQRDSINTLVGALDQERCRNSRLVAAIKEMTKTPPVMPTWVENVACSDLKSPLPPFPAPLP